MFLKQTKLKNGDFSLFISKSVRVPGKSGNINVTIKSLGKLSDLKKIYDDPIAHFKQLAKQMTVEEKDNLKDFNITLRPGRKASESKSSPSINLSTVFLSRIYHSLDIHSEIKRYSARHDKKLPALNKILMFLVFLRILNPASKSKSFSLKDHYGENFNFTLHNVYDSLKHFAKMKNDIVKIASNNVKNIIPVNTKNVHYDLTNFFIYTKEQESVVYLKRGYSKEHSQYPIVQMALLSDSNGVPLSYKLYPGNNPDVSTLTSFINEQNKIYNISKSTIIADAGLLSNDNIVAILKNKSQYILKKPMKRLSKDEFKMFKETIKPTIDKALELRPDLDSVSVSVDINVERTHKNIKGEIIKTPLKQKYLFMYSRKSFIKDQKRNDQLIENALDIINSDKKYTKELKKYTNNLVETSAKTLRVNDETGEIQEYIVDRKLNEKEVNKLKDIEGYSLIVTSCTEMPNKEIIKAYKNQYVIEECFKITKSEIESRPVYLTKDEHVEAHFLTCFLALQMIRILQKLLGNRYSVHEIKEVLESFTYNYVDTNIYKCSFGETNYPKILKDLSEKLDIDVDLELVTPKIVANLFAKAKKIEKK